jgi:hypothetical protein
MKWYCDGCRPACILMFDELWYDDILRCPLFSSFDIKCKWKPITKDTDIKLFKKDGEDS